MKGLSRFAVADLRVLDALETLIRQRDDMDGPVATRLYGTTSFELVWEDALRDLFGNDIERPSLGEATWYTVSGGVLADRTVAASRRLDFAVETDDQVILCDAKYYHPFPDRKPGWEDIIKQIYYAQSMLLPTHKRLRNAFLLPLEGSPLSFAASSGSRAERVRFSSR